MTTDRFRRYGNLLRSDGTNQLQRLLPALEADYIVPDERSFSDLVEYARSVAAEIRFYDLSGQSTGDWRAFVELLLDPRHNQVLPDAAARSRSGGARGLAAAPGAVPRLPETVPEPAGRSQSTHRTAPALLLRDRAGPAPRAASPDDVHVVFELARNAAPTLFRRAPLLDAGKDDKGRPLSLRDAKRAGRLGGHGERHPAPGDGTGSPPEPALLRGRRLLPTSKDPASTPFGRGQLDLDATSAS